MTTWWNIRKETIGVFLKQKLLGAPKTPVGGNDNENVGLTPLTTSLIEDELSEGLSVTSSDTSNATKDGDVVDSLSYTEEDEDDDDEDEEEEEEDDSAVFNGEPPSVIMVAVMVSSFDCDEEDDELPPQSTISVLQQLFDDLDEEEFGTAGNFQIDSRTIVSALSSVMTQ